MFFSNNIYSIRDLFTMVIIYKNANSIPNKVNIIGIISCIQLLILSDKKIDDSLFFSHVKHIFLYLTKSGMEK